MNENSKQPAPAIINDWLSHATTRLTEAGIPSARLDAELILAHVLGVERTWIIAHAHDSIALFEDRAFPATASPDKHDQVAVTGSEKHVVLSELLRQRAERIPLAYLLGYKEFYRRKFTVTRSVLIPRPETETMIDIVKKYIQTGRVIDVGCGSGCIGITASLELPELEVTLADVSAEALEIASENRDNLAADVSFVHSDLLSSPLLTRSRYDAVMANLPYVDREWERSPETDAEPPLALFADNHGLKLISRLIEQTPTMLNPGGYLFLEADPEQHDAIIKTGAAHGLRLVEARDYIVVLQAS